MPFAGWSPIGIASLIAIVGGIVLLVVYAVQRGLLNRELEGIEEPALTGTETTTGPEATAGRPAPAGRSRTLGSLGAALLVLGLALGVISATGGWGTGTPNGGPGAAPGDCAQSWPGCPKATPNP